MDIICWAPVRLPVVYCSLLALLCLFPCLLRFEKKTNKRNGREKRRVGPIIDTWKAHEIFLPEPLPLDRVPKIMSSGIGDDLQGSV